MEDVMEDFDMEELTTEENEKRQKLLQELTKALHNGMSQEMIKALCLYYQQFGELNSLGVRENLERHRDILDEFTDYVGTSNYEAVAEYLESAMLEISDILEEHYSSKGDRGR